MREKGGKEEGRMGRGGGRSLCNLLTLVGVYGVIRRFLDQCFLSYHETAV